MTVLLLMKVKNLFLFAVKLNFIPHPFGVGYLSSGRSAPLRFARGCRPDFEISGFRFPT